MPLPKAKSNPLLSNSLSVFIIRFFPSLANLLVVIWYSRHLSTELYGSYQHFWIQMNVIYPLACFGIHVLAITYSESFIKGLLVLISTKYYLLYALWVAALSTVFGILQSSSLNVSFAVPFFFMIGFSVSVIFESLLIVSRHYRELIVINVLYSIAWCYIHWYALTQPFYLQSLFTWLLLITLVRLLLYLFILAPKVRAVKAEKQAGSYNVAAIRSLWLHLGLYDFLQILFSWIDKFIISLVLSASVSAIYYNGSQNIPVLPLLLSAAGSAVLMQLATVHKENEREDIISLLNRSGRVLSCIVFPVFFFLLLFRQELILKLLTDKYAAAIPVFAVSILVLPVKAYSFTTALQRMHKGALINIGAIGDLLLACALMYPLYQWLGLPGVALSFVISTYLQAAFYLLCSARLLQTSPLKLIPYANWLIKLIVFASLFIAIHYAGGLYFRPEITLILGVVAMVIVILSSLLIEFQIQRKHGGI
jgi:O-antigen/teichoic acid export membrane protein